MCLWQPKKRHDRVTNKLLEGATMLSNDALGVLIVTPHQGANIFRIKCLTQHCGAGHVSKKDGDKLSLFRHEWTFLARIQHGGDAPQLSFTRCCAYFRSCTYVLVYD